MASNPISSWQIGVKKLETVAHFIFLVSKITVDSDYSHKIERHLHLERTAMTNLDRVLKSKDITLSTKVHLVKAMIFPVVTYICERWTEKKAEHRRIDVFQLWCGEDSWESLDSKEIKLVNPKGNPPWIFIGRTDVEAEAPMPWPPDVKSQLIGKDCDAGKDWRQEEKGMTEDEMAGWHHRLDGHEFEQALGVGDGQGSLACCSPWVTKSWTWLSDWTTTI